MKIFFEKQIAEDEAFTKYIHDKIDDVKASLTRVRTSIRKMESKSEKDAWKVAIDCFKETKDRLELKLSRLTQLANENFDGVKELKMIFYIGLVLASIGGSGFNDALRLAWVNSFMESLHVSVQKIVESGLFLPIQVGNFQKVTLSHLFYADDAIFIGKWSHDNVIAIARLLQCFYMASCLSVSFHKSTLLGIVVSYHEVECMASNVGCKSEKLPLNYLGVKIGENMSRIESWKEEKGLDLMEFCQKKVGDGQGTRFWLDKWVGDQTLKEAYSRIFALELDKEIKEVQMMELRSAISSIIMAPVPDRWVWMLDGSRSFTVGSARVYIDKKLLISGSDSMRWCKVVPLKFPENSFEVLKLLENSVEVLTIMENKLESMKILENKLESLKLHEEQPVDGLVPPSTKIYIRKCFR
ncbi:hypothetical protein Tco_1138090 [Tanacetum coccineum]